MVRLLKRFMVGTRVISRIRRGYQHTYTEGRIISLDQSEFGRCAVVQWLEGSQSLMATSDLRRVGTKAPHAKPWIETERQGRGRRYWFRTRDEAMRFTQSRQTHGYMAVWDGTTVWVPFAKKLNSDTIKQMAGRDE